MIKRLPWLRNRKKTDPEIPVRLPLVCGPMSNGEGWWPDSARKRLIRKLVHEKAEEISRREGVDRREFLASACGMATTLYMINLVNGCSNSKTPVNNMLGTGGGSGKGGGTGSGGKGGGGSGSSGKGGGVTGSSGKGGSMDGGPGGGPGGGSGDGGFTGMTEDAMVNEDAALCALGDGGNELIIDMQSHFANTTTNPIGAIGLGTFVGQINNMRFPWIQRTPGCSTSDGSCYDQQEYIDQIFMNSDTTIGVLSGISYAVGADGTGTGGFAALSNEDLIAGAMELEAKYPGRMLTHCMVMPNDRLDLQLAMMERNAGTYDNWKTYPPWSPAQDAGYWLDQGEGPTMIQKGLDLNSPIFCIHKGFPLNGFSPTYTNPKDVGPAAKMFPKAYLVIYHSAFEHGLASGDSTQPDINNPTADVGWGPGVGQWPEGPYDESLEAMGDMQPTATGSYPLNRGVNSLIKSLRDNGIPPNSPEVNIYAECGGVWPSLMVGRMEEAMHYWGKLLKYVGEDRLVWGTDCLWFGCPQPVIQAFRAFEISQEFQDKYGYPALTKARKEKILGQNAARLQNVRKNTIGQIKGCHSDFVGHAFLKLKRELDQEFGKRRDMMRTVPAPRTRREFLALMRSEHREKVAVSGRIPSLHPQRRG